MDLIVDFSELESLTPGIIEALGNIQENVKSEGGKFGVLAPMEQTRADLFSGGMDPSIPVYAATGDIGKTPVSPSDVPPTSSAPTESVAEVQEPELDESTSDTSVDSNVDASDVMEENPNETVSEDILLDDGDDLEDILLEEPSSTSESKESDSLFEEEEIPLIPLSEEGTVEEVDEVSSAKEEKPSEPEEFEEIELEPLMDEEPTAPSKSKAVEPEVPKKVEEKKVQEKKSEEEREEPKPPADKEQSSGRLGARDRLSSPTSRKVMGKGRQGGRAWASTSDVEKTGVVFVDDTVEGEVINKDELQKEAAKSGAFTSDHLAPKSSSKGILIVLVLVLAVIGGLIFLLKDRASSTVFEEETEQPYVSDVVEEPETGDEVVDSLSAETEELEETEEESVSPSQVSKKKPVAKRKPVSAKMLNVLSNPSGATVFVNGSKKGKSPMEIELTRTSNKIVLQLDGYRDYRVTVSKNTTGTKIVAQLVKERPPARRVEPKKETAKPDVKKEPELSDEPKEKETKKEPVKESVKESKVEEKKEPSKKEEPAKEPELEDKPKAVEKPAATGAMSKVFVASKPPGADIFVNGKKMSGVKSPGWLELPAGNYTIMLKKDGAQAEKEITIKEGKNKSQYLMLK